MARDKLDETRKVQKPPPDDVLSVQKKREWLPWEQGDVPCEICGLLCPLNCYEGFETVHITCTYTVSGKRWVKARNAAKKKALLASTKPELF
jgi:hypothetical protein